MKYSKRGLQLTESFEGCKLVAYKHKNDVWTIGYGHTRDVFPGMTCTPPQAERWLLEDVAFAEREVNRLVKVPLTQGEYDALVDFVFNCGAGNFEHSTLLRLLNDDIPNREQAEAIAAQFEKWDRCGGVELPGLLRRRKAEVEEFLQAV